MAWVVALLGLAALGYGARRFHAAWVRPWRDLQEIVTDIVKVRAPRTFVVDGNPVARRIGIALEDVFLRQREMTSRAREGELNVRTILGAMRDGLAVVDEEGRVQLSNSALARMFAIPEGKAGETPLETFRDRVIAQLIDGTLATGDAAQGSARLKGDRQIAITALPMETEGGKRGAVVLFQDVTQLQQLEQVRRDFVSNVSHELRTPLSIFRGYLETLLEEPDLKPKERQRIFQVLAKHSSRLHSLVDDLLSLARLEAPDPQLHRTELALPDLLERILHDWSAKAASKQIRLTLEAPADLPAISADEARLEEVVYNLLDNAVKYSKPGGEVKVALGREGADAVAFRVIDQGIGIAASDLPRVFERFYRADKARSRELGGTGLGLSIVKHIVQLHGGSVRAESQLGRGTTIHVSLPCTAIPADNSTSPDSAAASANPAS